MINDWKRQAVDGLPELFAGKRVASAEIGTFFARYRTKAILSFERGLSDLPPERLMTVGSFMID
jgi:hypothetical protein